MYLYDSFLLVCVIILRKAYLHMTGFLLFIPTRKLVTIASTHAYNFVYLQMIKQHVNNNVYFGGQTRQKNATFVNFVKVCFISSLSI